MVKTGCGLLAVLGLLLLVSVEPLPAQDPDAGTLLVAVAADVAAACKDIDRQCPNDTAITPQWRVGTSGQLARQNFPRRSHGSLRFCQRGVS